MEQNDSKMNKPAMMLILSSAAVVAGITLRDLIGGGRSERLCMARAAAYKIASECGYDKSDIMSFIGRDRTVAYNYEANIAGHLSKNADFEAICRAARKRIDKHPRRVENCAQPAPMEPAEAPVPVPPMPEECIEGWKGRLGWSFTAEECRDIWHAELEALERMKTFGHISRCERRQAPRKQAKEAERPEEMMACDAAEYLGVTAQTLVEGVKLCRLTRRKHSHGKGWWYRADELDRFKGYLEERRSKRDRKKESLTE